MINEPRIEFFPGKRLVGKVLTMSFAHDRTTELWRSFMPYRKQVPGVIGSALYSVQEYPSTQFFTAFDPLAAFRKWATVEAAEEAQVPEGMKMLQVPPGDYAVFIYRGLPTAAAPFFEHIFRNWLPASPWELDDRPHFEVLGDRYRSNDPASEEEVWVPVRLRGRKRFERG